MPDEKTTKAPETAAPDTGPGKTPEQAPSKEPMKTEAATLKEQPPEQTADKTAGAEKKDAPPVEKTGADKAAGDGGKAAPPVEKAGTEKAPNVSVYNFSEIMAGKQAEEKGKQPEKAASAPEKAAPSPEKGKVPSKPEKAVKKEPDKTMEPPKRRGRPPKETQAEAPADKKKAAPAKDTAPKQTSIWKEAKDKAAAGKEKAPKAPVPGKTADKGSAVVKPPVTERAKQPSEETPKYPLPPKEAPRRGEEQIVYIKLDELHAFKNHPFQVRDDEEMRAMVSSVRDKGVTQPAIVRPREDGGYEIVSGHRRQKASELAGYADMPCIVRNLTDDEAITQMVEDNLNQREEILPSERAKALKMQLEAIKHQGSRTSGQIDPKDAGKRSNEIVAERNKMAVKQVQRYIRLNELVPDLMTLMDNKKLGFTTAVELSYISKKNQNYIAVAIDSQQSSPSQAQAKRMRELDEKKLLNGDVIDGIMMEDKKEVDKVILTGAELSKYFGKETTPREMKDQIIKLLDDWKGQQKEHEKPEKKTEKEK